MPAATRATTSNVVSPPPRSRLSAEGDPPRQSRRSQQTPKQVAAVTPDLASSKRRYTQSTAVASNVNSSPSKRTRTSSSAKKGKTTKKKGSPSSSPLLDFQPPSDWQMTYQLVRELRQDRTAPCDHSGCEALMGLSTNPKGQRFYALIALMLSSQTKDAVVANAMKRMHEDGVLHVDAIVALERSKLSDDYLYSVGFRNNKAKYMQQACQILKERYESDIPPTAKEMMELPGVGPKMAYICENAAWDRQSGIGVDTHMHRLFPLLRWVPRNSKSPEHTRVALEAWLPREYWKDVNLLWVGFGQEVQQQREKMLQKAFDNCSRPYEALQLLRRCGLNPRKVASKCGLQERLDEVMSSK